MASSGKECGLCLLSKNLIQLSICKHQMCLDCFSKTVLETSTYPVQCGFCPMKIRDKDIRKNLTRPQVDKYNENQKTYAITHSDKDTVRCHQENCLYSGLIDKSGGYDQYWICPLCKSVNCLSCRAVHTGMKCEDYLRNEVAVNSTIKKDFMQCVKCQVFIKKTQGCTYILCYNCKTDLCWDHKTEFQKSGCSCPSYLKHRTKPQYRTEGSDPIAHFRHRSMLRFFTSRPE